MKTYLVEVYKRKGHYRIRACRTDGDGTYRDRLSPETVRYAVVGAPTIYLARQSMLAMAKLDGKRVGIDGSW